MIGFPTIFALSSGRGVSAVAVIRASGPKVPHILEQLTHGRVPLERHFQVRPLYDPESGDVLDVAGVIWMKGPRSFTGEDLVEFHVHGSRATVAAVLRVMSGFREVRMAEPGEFSRRAFVNGKMDLVEAEGLADLLNAQTDRQRRQAIHAVEGGASSVFNGWRERLVEIRALVEAAVDFVDEAGVAESALARIREETGGLLSAMKAAVASAGAAEVVREGLRVALVGRPNTGKSSLLNALVGREAALVSPQAGTTRDIIEVVLDMAGVPVIVSDMAGLRDNAADEVEAAGVRKARGEMAGANVIVWVCSPDIPGSETVEDGLVPDAVVLGKSDLVGGDSILFRNKPGPVPFVSLSAKSGQGMGQFLEVLSTIVGKHVDMGHSNLAVTARQREALSEAIGFLEQAGQIDPDRLEIMAESVRAAATSLGRITGRTDVEEWLGAIFSRFCVGK